MIKIEKVDVFGIETAIRGMRNSFNSWDKSDSVFSFDHSICKVGDKDYDLMKSLSKSGSSHAKFRRMIHAQVDITAPLYWWKEFDTYKVGTVANSCSTMHTITEKEFSREDFSWEHLGVHVPDEDNPNEDNYLNLWPDRTARVILDDLNQARNMYLREKDPGIKKQFWWQIIQLLPSSYNQKRTIDLNYEVLHSIYNDRKNHKLDEWREFCNWIEKLPLAEGVIYE